MADVFVVYAREDRAKAEKLVECMCKKMSVWWDDALTGDFRIAIPNEIANAKCVVALFSKASVRKTGSVGEDLEVAKRNKKTIIPLQLEECDPIYGFGNLSSVDFRFWDEREDHPCFQHLMRKLRSVILDARPQREQTVLNGRVALPAKFLSVSSHETRLDPLPAVQALQLCGAPSILVSAYDTHPEKCAPSIPKLLADYRRSGGTLLMDSGNYEASRRNDKLWTKEKLWESLKFIEPDMAFCFDEFNVPKSVNEIVAGIVAATRRDQDRTKALLLPIVHTSRRGDGSYDSDKLPAIIKGVAKELRPEIVAVPERELGSGLVQRAHTVRAIRNVLNELDWYQPIHLLGTGNPWSIIIFSAAGADTFDGLEWCRTVVDHDSGKLHHDQHYDFFSFQDGRDPSSILAEVVRSPHINFAGKVAVHNITFFLQFTQELRAAFLNARIEDFARGVIGAEHVSALTREFPELFLP